RAGRGGKYAGRLRVHVLGRGMSRRAFGVHRAAEHVPGWRWSRIFELQRANSDAGIAAKLASLHRLPGKSPALYETSYRHQGSSGSGALSRLRKRNPKTPTSAIPYT